MLLLDLICHRYPNRRPSDYFGDHLTDQQAFILDASLALKYDATDKDERYFMLDRIIMGLHNLLAAWAGKKIKSPELHKPLIKPRKKEEDLEEAWKIIQRLSGGATVFRKEK